MKNVKYCNMRIQADESVKTFFSRNIGQCWCPVLCDNTDIITIIEFQQPNLKKHIQF